MTDDSRAGVTRGLSDPTPAAGRQFREYQIVRQLGNRTPTQVFLARDTTLGGRWMVVKVSPFDLVGDIAFSLPGHPGIDQVTACDYDAPSGLTVLAMPYRGDRTTLGVVANAFSGGKVPLRGDVLFEAAGKRSASEGAFIEPDSQAATVHPQRDYVDGVLGLAEQVGLALSHSHQHGVSHGAIHPANVLVSPNAAICLVDFVRPVAPGGWSHPEFMAFVSPEILRARLESGGIGGPEFSPAADVYAWGVLMYFMLTGTLPYGDPPEDLVGEDAARWHLVATARPPRPIGRINPRVSAELENLVLRCCHPDQARRISSVDQGLVELRRHRTPLARWSRWVTRARRLLSTAAAVCVLVCAAGFAWWQTPTGHVDQLVEQAFKAYEQENDYLAKQRCDRTLELSPNDHLALLVRGAACRRDRANLDPERRWFSTDVPRSLDICPTAEGHWLLAEGYLLPPTRDHDRAHEHYRQALELAPDYGVLRRAYVSFLIHIGNKSPAVLEAVDQAIACDPQNGMGYLLKASVLRESNSAQADEALLTALRLSGESISIKMLVADGLATRRGEKNEAAVQQALTESVQLGVSGANLSALPDRDYWSQKDWWPTLEKKAESSYRHVNLKELNRLHAHVMLSLDRILATKQPSADGNPDNAGALR